MAPRALDAATATLAMPRITEPSLRTDALAAAGDDSFVDPQGRRFQRRNDPATGHVYWEHADRVADQAGNRLATEIVIDIAPQGTVVRTERQRLERANGDIEQLQRAVHFDGTGKRTSEVTDTLESTTKDGVRREEKAHIVGTIQQEQLVRQRMDMRVVEQVGEAPGQTVRGETTIRAEWDNDGQPIDQNTVPTLQREQVVRYDVPGGGLHKGYPRIITTAQRASGRVDALQHEPMALTVRFEGKGGQYLERQLEVPVDGHGQAEMARARTIKEIDGQSRVDKGLMQARIWGGFASSLAIIVGANLLRTPLGGVGKALVGGGLVASTASLTGEVHAVATERNDASWARLAMGVYDTTWNGLYAALLFGRSRRGAQVHGASTARPDGAAMLAMSGAGVGVLGRTALDANADDGDALGGWTNLRGDQVGHVQELVPEVPGGMRTSLRNDLASISEQGAAGAGALRL